ncbi:disintegrin and metalloproteinase domain-containing protein 20-like [Pogona vitticeps]
MAGNFAQLELLILWSILIETAGQKLPLGFRYGSYEVTIPQKLTTRYGQEDPQRISYLLQIKGVGHIVHLRQKRDFVSKHFPFFTYTKNGELHVDYPFIRNDCFYSGFVQDNPHSLVTLSTCSEGLSGLLQLGNETYEIEPVPSSITFQHVVYRLEEKEDAVPMRCALTEEEQSHQGAMIPNREMLESRGSKEDWWTHTRYADIAIVVEHKRFKKFGRNETLTGIHILEIVHNANTFYEPLGVVLSVAGLEIWTESNLIVIADEINVLLNNFNSWRTNTLNKHLPNDAAHLFVHKLYGHSAGLAFTGTICSYYWASAVEAYVGFSVPFFSVLFAHELGHNLGMNHDGKYCSCGQKSCIMSAVPENVDKFSNCSYNSYFKLRNSHCLLKAAHPDTTFKLEYCGNKIVEKGEQCDCGSKAQCELDSCCQSDCKLRSGSTCNIGMCCAKCQYLPAGTVCREKTSVCDLPEYCNGTSEWCPDDFYVQDGAPCKDGAHCYHGDCTTHNEQCKVIFGKKATVATENCFRVLNARGDRFGNCGLINGVYSRCKAENILCGRIQCDNVKKLPSLEEDSTIIQTFLGRSRCWGTDYHLGMETADIGAVKDGTHCGIGMLCLGGQCKNISILNYDCDVKKCHNHGICNSAKHCHCDYGWAPPDCLGKGYGGSIDSGPALQDKSGIIAGTIVGTLFVLMSTVGLCIYHRNVLRYHLRRMSSDIYPTQSVLE